MLNIGIIGPGRISEKHAASILVISNAQLWSVAGRTLESAKKFSEKYQAHKAYDSIQEMLGDPHLHAVILATPDNLHAEQVILAARAGKAILVEKPLCTSIQSCQEISAEIKKHPVPISINYHLRWHHGFRLVAKKAHNNELGKIQTLKLQWGINYIAQAKWHLDSNFEGWCSIGILGTHLVDLARWILIPTCGDIVNQSSKVTYRPNTKIDEKASILLEFESGAKAELLCSLVSDEPLQIEIIAENKNVCGTDLAGPQENREIFIGDQIFNCPKADLYTLQLQNFVSSIIENRPMEVSLEDGLKNVQCLLAMHL